MKTIGDKFEPFKIIGVRPEFNNHEENGESALEDITETSLPDKWRVIFFYPKNFTFVCPTEIVAFAKLDDDFIDQDTIVLDGSTDNEFVKLVWRHEHKDLNRPSQQSSTDSTGTLVNQLGVCEHEAGVALCATFIVDPDDVIQHASVNDLNMGRNPDETLRILDDLQTDELCPCNRAIGDATL